jgi:hypothetical protein
MNRNFQANKFLEGLSNRTHKNKTKNWFEGWQLTVEAASQQKHHRAKNKFFFVIFVSLLQCKSWYKE